LPGGPIGRPLVMGVAFGTAWTPCVGPLLGAALVVAANSRAPLNGAVLLGAYSLGIGAPFVAIALASASSTRVPTLIRRWSRRIAPVAALALIGFGVLLATGVYDRLVGEVNLTGVG
jgi:cytochrome c-type biogenesis protein